MWMCKSINHYFESELTTQIKVWQEKKPRERYRLWKMCLCFVSRMQSWYLWQIKVKTDWLCLFLTYLPSAATHSASLCTISEHETQHPPQSLNKPLKGKTDVSKANWTAQKKKKKKNPFFYGVTLYVGTESRRWDICCCAEQLSRRVDIRGRAEQREVRGGLE